MGDGVDGRAAELEEGGGVEGVVGEGKGTAGVEVGVPEEAVALVVVPFDVNGGVGCGAPVDDPGGRGALVSGFILGQAE